MDTVYAWRDGAKMLLLTANDRAHPLFQDYVGVRDYFYTEKKAWESSPGLDRYDPKSNFLLLGVGEVLVAGCRVINGATWLPIHTVLADAGLPVDQVPSGSIELSRFGINPAIHHGRSGLEYLTKFSEGMLLFAKQLPMETAYAVLRCELGKMLRKIGISIEPLEHSTTVSHGTTKFSTVQFTVSKSRVRRSDLRQVA